MPPTDNCAVCQTPAKQWCSACKMVKYCGAEHQRKHWQTHKQECQPFRLARDPQLGRHLVATRDIAADSVVFTEAPLIVGPKWYLNEQEAQVPVMPCVGCFTPCRMGVYSCERCQWPACRPDCAGLLNPQLHAFECNILQLGPGPAARDINALIDYYRCDALIVLKCLLLQRTQPKKWQQLMDMQSHEHERLGSELHKEAEQRIVAYLQHNFLQRLQSIQTNEQLLREYDAQVLHRICGIIETNYMCISLATGVELSGLYYNACMMEHTCQPNCYFQFDQRQGFRISVIAGRTISKGEHLHIMYSNMLWGTQMRQEHLNITKHFQCKCTRCSDPTEFGTNFSTLLCMGDVGKDCGGLQLPKDPLNEKSDWACDKCPMIISSDEVRFLLTQITDEVETLLARKPSVKQLQTLIAKLSKFLHPNHYHMFSLKHSLIQLYGTESGYALSALSEELLQKKRELCEELFNTCQKLDPPTIRLSVYVGIILYEWHTVLLELGRRTLAKAEKTAEDIGSALANFTKANEHLALAKKVLKKELDNVAGNKLNEAVLKASNDLMSLIQQTSKN